MPASIAAARAMAIGHPTAPPIPFVDGSRVIGRSFETIIENLLDRHGEQAGAFDGERQRRGVFPRLARVHRRPPPLAPVRHARLAPASTGGALVRGDGGAEA